MKLSILLLLTGVLFFSSCEKAVEDKGKGTLEVIFKAEYGGSPLVMFQNNATGKTNPSDIKIKRLEFFLSQIKSTFDGKSTDLKDVAYINMGLTTTTALAETGVSFMITDLPTGTYTNLDFGVGVTPAIDSTTPADYATTSPLGINGNYWANWNSYITSRIEGEATHADSTTNSFLYHSGVDGLNETVQMTTSFDISKGQTTQVVVTIKGEDLFFKTGSEIDVIVDNSTHSGAVGSANYLLAKKSLVNLAHAMEVK